MSSMFASKVAELVKRKPLILELGCGSRKTNEHSVGIDLLANPDVDIVGDVFEVLKEFPSDSVDEVRSHHFVEHIDDLGKLIAELGRVLKEGARIEFVAPHFSNPYFYSDPTHRSYYGLYTFCYFANGAGLSRRVPTYDAEIRFALESVDLVFKSARPFYGRYAVKKVFGAMFNSCRYMKELYEENFCYMFPCYEVAYRLRKIK